MKDLVKRRKQEFEDKDYRHGYVDEFLNSRIATQIKVLREQRGLSQQELADLAGMKQPRISVMENVNYSSWSINVLRKLAEAFDLALSVSFEEFGTRANNIDEFSRENLERRSFKDDPYFRDAQGGEIADEPPAPPLPGGQGLGTGEAKVTGIDMFRQAKITEAQLSGLSGGGTNEASVR
jgi:transcriptional regulator with XRE-family HTH domain